MSTATITPTQIPPVLDRLTPWAKLHPYMVYGPRGFDSRFSDLRCAARTALERGEEFWVVDERNGRDWRGAELKWEVER